MLPMDRLNHFLGINLMKVSFVLLRYYCIVVVLHAISFKYSASLKLGQFLNVALLLWLKNAVKITEK